MKSIATRIDEMASKLAQASDRDLVHGLPRATFAAVLESVRLNEVGIDIRRKIAFLQGQAPGATEVKWLGGEKLSVADIPRLEAESDANWEAWITERHGADVAAVFLHHNG